MAYSSGIGASGVPAALSYAALSDIGISSSIILLLMIVIPLLQIVAFLFIKESNATELPISDTSSNTSLIDEYIDEASTTSDSPPMTLTEKWQYLPKLTKYFVPLLINCLCEYVITQMVRSIQLEKGTYKFLSLNFSLQFDLLYIPDIWLNRSDQYRWLQVFFPTIDSYSRTFLLLLINSFSFLGDKRNW